MAPLLVPAALALLLALVGPTPARAEPGRPFDWPVQPRPPVVTAFDPPEQRWLPGHRGVDLDAGVDPRHTVRAAGAGVVVFAGAVAGRNVLSIDHDGGLRTTYEPVAASVAVGSRVRTGQPVGTVERGHPQCVVTWCLHWGLRRGRDYLDPTAAVTTERIRLKPVTSG